MSECELITIHMNINGNDVSVAAKPNERLVDVLRERLLLTGTKEGCGIGECGACTVIVEGETMNSCLVLAAQMEGKRITTIEGIAKDGELHPIQKSFLYKNAIQCGFCTPGFVLSAKALLDKNPKPTRDEVKEAISGNLCRCTGYEQIIEAVLDASNTIEG